mgnify:CR=1 FL=1
MKLAIVSKSNRGSGLYLSPSSFGDKIEFIARECGEFKEGELVITLASVHDTKPDQPRKGVRFVRVKRPNAVELEEISSKAFVSRKTFITQAFQERFMVVKEELFLMLFIVPFGHVSSVTVETKLQLRTFNLEHSCLGLNDCRWGAINEVPKISLNTTDSRLASGTVIEVPDYLTREVMEKIFHYDLALEREKERQRREEVIAAQEKAVAAKKLAREMEEQRRINLFLSVYPEAIEWCLSPLTWEMLETEAVNRNLTNYLGEWHTDHYASFSKEIDWYERRWELVLKDDKIIITRGYTVES